MPASSRQPANVVRGLRLLVGPLALAGFFLPWTHGIGPLAATEFTGFRLVGFAGRLQTLDLTPAQGGALWIFRLAILGVALSGTWLTLLAPVHPWHRVYVISGWYVGSFATVAFALGLAKAGPVAPPIGLALLAVSGLLFAALEFLTRRRPTGR